MKELIRAKMKEKKISVTEMALRADISRVCLSKYFNGHTDLGSQKFLRILEVLDMIIITKGDN